MLYTIFKKMFVKSILLLYICCLYLYCFRYIIKLFYINEQILIYYLSLNDNCKGS